MNVSSWRPSFWFAGLETTLAYESKMQTWFDRVKRGSFTSGRKM